MEGGKPMDDNQSVSLKSPPHDNIEMTCLHSNLVATHLDNNLGITRLNIYKDSSPSSNVVEDQRDDLIIITDDEQETASTNDNIETCARTTPYYPDRQKGYESQSDETVSSPRKMSSSSSSSNLSSLRSSPNQLESNLNKLKKRRNFCPFCKKLITNFSRHLVTIHRNETDVKQYIDLSRESPKKRKQKRAIITNKIRNIGNDIYNRRIVENNGNDNYLPVKRSSHQKHKVNNLTHVICKHCLGFFKKELLHKHISKCKQFSSVKSHDDQEARGIKKKAVLQDHSMYLVKDNKNASELLKKEVFPKMQKDAETLIAQSDSTIAKYGSNLRFTHRTERQIHYCSSKMRGLAKLFIMMKNKLPDIKEFRDCIRPKNFNVLVESVRQMGNFETDNGIMNVPSVPPRLCSSLKRCANIVKSDTIKDESLTREEKLEIISSMDDFLFLMDKDWATEVGTNGENSRKKMKVIKKDLLPDPEDIRTISRYISDMCPVLIHRLQQIPTVSNYEMLAKLIITHIITLNRRRPNETVEITLEAYQTTLNKRLSYGQDLQSILSKEDIDYGNELSIFYISANKNLKKVPILLTKIFLKAVNALIEAREKIGITSRYLFGRPGSPELFDGSAVLREIVNKANLKSPSTFTANSLRHHAATSSQLHARNDTFTKRLSQFMGHDLKTHESYYEMPLPLVQKFLVGPKLLQMTLPKSSSSASETVTSNALSLQDSASEIQYFHMSTTETNQSEDSNLSMNQSEDSNLSTSTFGTTDTLSQNDVSVPSTSNSDATDALTSIPSTSTSDTTDALTKLPSSQTDKSSGETHNESLVMTNAESQNDPDFVPDYANNLTSSEGEENLHLSTEYVSKKTHKKVRWTVEEKTVIYEKFGRHFHMDTVPVRKEIKKVWETEKALGNRSLQQVVTYINNIVKKKQRISTPIRQKIKNMVTDGREKFSP